MHARIREPPERVFGVSNEMRRTDDFVAIRENFTADGAFSFAAEDQSHDATRFDCGRTVNPIATSLPGGTLRHLYGRPDRFFRGLREFGEFAVIA